MVGPSGRGSRGIGNVSDQVGVQPDEISKLANQRWLWIVLASSLGNDPSDESSSVCTPTWLAKGEVSRSCLIRENHGLGHQEIFVLLKDTGDLRPALLRLGNFYQSAKVRWSPPV